MDPSSTSSPRKARKTFLRSPRNAVATPNINQLVSTATPSSAPNPTRKSARKSAGTLNTTANANQIDQSISDAAPSSIPNHTKKSARKSTGIHNASYSNQTDRVNKFATEKCSNITTSNETRNSVGISQASTLPLSQPSSRYDNDSSDPDENFQPSSTGNSLSSTLPLSLPGCSRDPDSSDSEGLVERTQKILRPTTPTSAPKKAKKIPAIVSSSSPPSTSEESEVEEMLRKKAEKKNKSQSKANNSASQYLAVKAGKSSVAQSNLVSQCVFYILVANGSKKAIKKRDILQNVFDGRNTDMFPEVIKKAASTLQKTFGFELMELKSSKNEYLLVNKLSHEHGVQEFAEYSPFDRQKQGFIFYVLTLIFMNENSIMEDELWKALDPLGIEVKSKKLHPIFGDVQKFVTTTLVKQMYIERRLISKDPPQYELTWGERANKEVLKEDLLEFVCKIMPDTTPEKWILQYKDATGKSPDGDAEGEMD